MEFVVGSGYMLAAGPPMGPRCDADGAPTKLDYKKKQHGANTVQAFIVRKTNLQNDFELNTKP